MEKRSLPEDEGDGETLKRTCILNFNDCKDEEKFIICMIFKTWKRESIRFRTLKEEDWQSLQPQHIEWTQFATLYQIL